MITLRELSTKLFKNREPAIVTAFFFFPPLALDRGTFKVYDACVEDRRRCFSVSCGTFRCEVTNQCSARKD